MKNKVITILAFLGIAFFCCTSPKKIYDPGASENIPDWAGLYYGILPCASCEGIETELTLRPELSYILLTKYIGEESKTFTKKGSLTLEGSIVKLSGIKEGEAPYMFKIEKDLIRQLDLAGNEISGDLASNSLLAKCGNPQVEDKRWKLIELNGKAVEGNAETHYLIFHSKDSKIEAKAGCNVLLFNYKILQKFKLRVSPGISTLMACPDDTEQNLLKVFTEADNITFNDTYLSLNKGRMAPLARLELVK